MPGKAYEKSARARIRQGSGTLLQLHKEMIITYNHSLGIANSSQKTFNLRNIGIEAFTLYCTSIVRQKLYHSQQNIKLVSLNINFDCNSLAFNIGNKSSSRQACTCLYDADVFSHDPGKIALRPLFSSAYGIK